jgi:hypothetical protein
VAGDVQAVNGRNPRMDDMYDVIVLGAGQSGGT